jgi:enoyl-CoA hydratase
LKKEMTMAFECITVETRGRVGLITIDRPSVMNALNTATISEISRAVDQFEADQNIGAMVITGSAKAFAAGADISEMADLGFVEAYLTDHASALEHVGRARKPIIAAVAGYCLGGGNELAMMCDFIIAADTARFGQPEITLGIIPGIGGTQRLPRAIGKAKAMDLILTGRMMDANEAESAGLVARVVPADDLLEEALGAATKIAGYSRVSVMMAKESVNSASQVPLAEGRRLEQRLFHALFATDDQKEGMDAFLNKRSPQFKNR